MNRREIIASGLALSLLLPGAAASRFGSVQRLRRDGVRYFVADSRSPIALAAASTAAAQGAAVVLASTDVTPLYAALDELWRNGPEAVAGVTTAGTAFVVERLALHHGLRIVHRSFAPPRGIALVGWARAADERPRGLRALAPPQNADDRNALVSWLLAPKRA